MAITALYQRAVTGVGQQVETSLYASALCFQYANLFATSITGAPLDLLWDRSKNPPLRTTYECGDGKWMMAANSPTKYWPAFCKIIGHPDLVDDPRFATRQGRLDNIFDVFAIVDPIMKSKRRDEWLDVFASADLIFMPINSYSDVLVDVQAEVNRYVTDYTVPGVGAIKVPGYPVVSARPTGTSRPAPGLGQDTDDVLRALGFSADEVEKFRSDNLVK